MAKKQKKYKLNNFIHKNMFFTQILFFLLKTGLTYGVNNNIQSNRSPLWIYILGDSSLRMFNSALIHNLNGTLEDAQFGSWETPDAGGCIQHNDGDRGLGCLREFFDWDKKIRITFSFKTFATQKVRVLDHLITSSAQPDIFVLATGAHDFYHGHSVNTTVLSTIKWLEKMQNTYPQSKKVFCTLVACFPNLQKRAIEFNNAIREKLPKVLPEITILDRQTNTINETNEKNCRGWHAMNSVVQSHVKQFSDQFFKKTRFFEPFFEENKCDAVELFECNEERFYPAYTECVTSLIAKRGNPSPFVPNINGARFWYKGKPGPQKGKHRVSYYFTENGPANYGKTILGNNKRDWVPFKDDKHRALVLTQPKVGTGALIAALENFSDLIVRSHEVEFLRAKEPWVPFTNCRAKPKLGNCTIFHGIREPHSWLASSYAQIKGKNFCEFNGTVQNAIDDYFDWLSSSNNIAYAMNWWRIGDQLRSYGISSFQAEKIISHILDSEGIAILQPKNKFSQQPWMHGCQIAVLQLEKQIPGSVSEKKIQQLIPGFRFKKTHSGRANLCPASAHIYNALQKTKIPTAVLKQINIDGSQRGQDFLATIKAYNFKFDN